MRINTFKGLHPKDSLSESANDFFDKMSQNFVQHLENGMFTNSETEALYIYEIEVGLDSYRGIVNTTEIQDLLDGYILFHEQTIIAKEDDMVETTLTRNARIKPVLLYHKPNTRLKQIIDAFINNNQQLVSFNLKAGQKHSLWKIDDSDLISEIKNVFLFGIKKAYIADGHHRCNASIRLHKKLKQNGSNNFNTILTAYFPEDILSVYDHVKMVKILDTIDPEEFITELTEYASVKPSDHFVYPTKKRDFVVILNGKIFKVKWRKQVLKSYDISPEALDVYIMNQIVIKHIFKIDDVRTDDRLSFFSGNISPEKILQKSSENPQSVIICQTPLSLSEIKKFSNKKKNLPPKSTWFEPRIRSGLIGQNLSG